MLDDSELNAFQVQCFNAPLQPEELMGVKKVVQDKMPQASSFHPPCLPTAASVLARERSCAVACSP